MGDEHGRTQPAPYGDCEEPSAPAGSPANGRPARADEGDDAGSGAGFPPQHSEEVRTALGFKLTHHLTAFLLPPSASRPV